MQELAMKQFIPFSDEWFERGLPLPGPLVPYASGMHCLHELDRPKRTEALPADPVKRKRDDAPDFKAAAA